MLNNSLKFINLISKIANVKNNSIIVASNNSSNKVISKEIENLSNIEKLKNLFNFMMSNLAKSKKSKKSAKIFNFRNINFLKIDFLISKAKKLLFIYKKFLLKY